MNRKPVDMKMSVNEIARLWVEIAKLQKDMDHTAMELGLEAARTKEHFAKSNNALERAERVLGTYMPRDLFDREYAAVNKHVLHAELNFKQLANLDSRVALMDSMLKDLNNWKNIHSAKANASEWAFRMVLVLLTLIISILGTKHFVGG